MRVHASQCRPMAFRPTSALGVGYAGSSASAGWLGATREASLGGYRSINDQQRPVYAVSRASALCAFASNRALC